MATKTSSRQIVNKDALANIGSTAGQELDNILSDIDSVIVTKDGTQTITNKTIDGDSNTVQDLPLTAHKTVVGDAGEVWQYDGSGVPTSSKTLNDMSITNPSRLDVKKDTKANLETYAATATNGQFVFATDEKKAYQVIDNALAPVGGGGVGGSEIFASYNSDDDSSTWSSGNNASLLGGGTLSSTFNQANATNPLHGNSSYTLTLSSGSLNDYVSTEVIPVPIMAQKNTCVVRTKYMFNGNDNDVELVVYDVTNSTVIGEKLLPQQTVSKLFEYVFNVPDTCVNLRVGFWVKVANNTKVLKWDDLEVSLWSPGVANLICEEGISYTGYTSGTTSGVKFKTLLSDSGSQIISDDNSGSYTKFNVLKKSNISLTASFDYGTYSTETSQIIHYDSGNNVIKRSERSNNSSNNGITTVSMNTPANAGDYFIATYSNTAIDTTTTNFSIIASAISENIIQTWQDGTEWTSYTPTFGAGFGTVSASSFKWKRNGSDILIDGQVTQGTPTSSVFSFTLPGGILTNILPSSIYGVVSYNQVLGSSNNYGISHTTSNSNLVSIFMQSSSVGWTQVTTTSPMPPAGATYYISARIPIQGWSSTPSLLALPTSKENSRTYSLTVTGSNWTTTTAKGNVYPTINEGGNIIWRMSFNVIGTKSTFSSTLFSISNVTFAANQQVNVGYADTTSVYARTTSSTGDIFVGGSGTGTYQVSGDVELSSKPSFANNYNPPGVFAGNVAKNQIAYLKDVKPSGTTSGTFNSPGWQTRVLNTIEGDSSIVSLSSNQFTLSTGSYDTFVSAPSHGVDLNQAVIYNVTDSTFDLIGQSSYNRNGALAATPAIVEGILNVVGTKVFEVRHRCSTGVSTNGLGQSAGFGVNEVFCIVRIEKLNGI